ncbi:hypothetical protein TNIN_246101 [Trichonephila inaurata madagascariensis]|uniref:Uncharacterized protein n=1 Tax=Trichonephila inaurata madagascariensis TaxID=2747483 RepID=A0A8X6X9F1_9ARAC|nr:hypothetical protein TNIN_246101 [Trichonephila inaurata madagascariensis]
MVFRKCGSQVRVIIGSERKDKEPLGKGVSSLTLPSKKDGDFVLSEGYCFITLRSVGVETDPPAQPSFAGSRPLRAELLNRLRPLESHRQIAGWLMTKVSGVVAFLQEDS